MLIILKDATQSELELLHTLLNGKELVPFALKDKPEHIKKDWIPASEFEVLVTEKGYRCKTSKARKALCERFGIAWEKRGKELWFRNQLDKVPDKNKRL